MPTKKVRRSVSPHENLRSARSVPRSARFLEPTACSTARSAGGLAVGGAVGLNGSWPVSSRELLFKEQRHLTVRLGAQVGGDLRDGVCVAAVLCLLRLGVDFGVPFG